MDKNLIYIEVGRLHPHPDNPRKSLGDIYELVESIKANGVLQNLTVVPNGDDYTIIIGHRRCEAAKAAGLEKLPCIVADMTPQEQIGTMLLENIQRADLTIYEQAQGFQMMLDMGDTVENVAEKTGFSASTVRRRVKLVELDATALQDACSRQVSLDQLDRLNKIENIEVRNTVLAEAGTNNFENALAKAMKHQKEEAEREAWRDLLESHGFIEIEYSECFSSSKYASPEAGGYITGSADEERLKGYDYEHKQHYYAFGRSVSVPYIRVRREDMPELDKNRAEEDMKRQRTIERKNRLEDIAKRAFELRKDFIKNFSLKDSKAKIGKINEWLQLREISIFAHSLWFSGYTNNTESIKTYKWLFDIEKAANPTYADVSEFVEAHPQKAMLYHTYALWSDNAFTCHDWEGKYRKNEKLEAIYNGLGALGYVMSDEEYEFLHGTSTYYADNEDSDYVYSDIEDLGDKMDDDEFDKELEAQLADE